MLCGSADGKENLVESVPVAVDAKVILHTLLELELLLGVIYRT